MTIGIYAIRNKINNKYYIGKSAVSIEKRWQDHKSELRLGKHTNKHLQNSYNKYGLNNFEFKIIEICSIDKVNEKEIYYIDKYNSFNNGYNKTKGGDGCLSRIVSPETKKKISESHKGENHYNYGGHISKEHKKVLIEGRKRTKMSNELKDFVSKLHLGKTMSDESRRKMSKSHEGKKVTQKEKDNLSEHMFATRNTTGFKHVSKEKDKQYKQCFFYRYRKITKDGEYQSVQRTSLKELEKAVKENGWDWEPIKIRKENKSQTKYKYVHKQKCKNCFQGFTYIYTYKKNGKRKTLSSVDIKILKKKVIEHGLEWSIKDKK